jgi:hypothetical protein
MTINARARLQLRLAARRVAGEHVPVRHEGVDKVGGIEQQQHDRDRKAEMLVDRRNRRSGRDSAFSEVKHRR